MRARKSSSLHSVRATPTTANAAGSRRRLARRSMAGMSLRAVRSPDAPKTTSATGGALRSPSNPSSSGLSAGRSSATPAGSGLGTGAALGLAGSFLGHLRRRRLGEEPVAAELVAQRGDD